VFSSYFVLGLVEKLVLLSSFFVPESTEWLERWLEILSEVSEVSEVHDLISLFLLCLDVLLGTTRFVLDQSYSGM